MAVTRKQVAEYASVSEATVSYVVNNGPRPVAPETRARVLEAIQQLGYYPSDVARSLRMQRTSTIGLVLPDLINPFYAEIAQTIENICYEQGYTVILCNSSMDEKREQDYVSVLRSKRVEGVILIPTNAYTGALAQLVEASISTVVLEYEIEGAQCIIVDEFQGGLLLTRHLLELGHRRIGCIIQAGDTSSSKTRYDGYTAALSEAGLPIDDQLVISIDQEIISSEAATLTLLDQPDPPTAIFVHNDRLVLGTLSAVRKSGLRTPEDISVVGYDDIAEAAYFNPPLTTIAYPKRRMGEEAVRLLFELIRQEGAIASPQTQILPVTLVQRESTAPLHRSES